MIKVSEKIFNALKSTENEEWMFCDEEVYLRLMLISRVSKTFKGSSEALNDINYKVLLKALDDGYEKELSDKDELVAIYKNYQDLSKVMGNDAYFYKGILHGIYMTLEKLGEKLKGVNK